MYYPQCGSVKAEGGKPAAKANVSGDSKRLAPSTSVWAMPARPKEDRRHVPNVKNSFFLFLSPLAMQCEQGRCNLRNFGVHSVDNETFCKV
jgi:hypothetical protein